MVLVVLVRAPISPIFGFRSSITTHLYYTLLQNLRPFLLHEISIVCVVGGAGGGPHPGVLFPGFVVGGAGGRVLSVWVCICQLHRGDIHS